MLRRMANRRIMPKGSFTQVTVSLLSRLSPGCVASFRFALVLVLVFDLVPTPLKIGTGLLGAVLETTPGARFSNPAQTNPPPLPIKETDAAIENEYRALQAADDAAQAEVERWLQQHHEQEGQAAAAPAADLDRHIRERFEPVRRAYEDFLARHPRHVPARLTYGSFLSDRQDEAGAQAQWEQALELDPRNAAALNNLAGVYAEREQPAKAFEFLSQAIELDPATALYYHNFANHLYVLRQSAMSYYRLNEQQVYAKALASYSNAFRLAPTNFTFAWDFAQTYYALQPLPTEPALHAWTNALAVAHDEIHRQGVQVHFARVKLLANRLPEARAHLVLVTHPKYSDLKTRLLRLIVERESATPATNGGTSLIQPKPKAP
jgi:tetratricopeptide (TPR) repeat protein